MIEKSTLAFLANLKANNYREWFQDHKKTYEAAKQNFVAFIQLVIDELGKTDTSIAGLAAKDCLFRINRDVRFSKDKSPYKTNFGASINKGGRKGMGAGYYFHCEPASAFLGGGVYQPPADITQKIRQEIDYCFTDWNNIITAPTFIKEYGSIAKDKAYTLSRPPKGYDANNPAIEYLKHTSWIATKELDTSELTSKKLLTNTIQTFQALTPFIDFLNTAL